MPSVSLLLLLSLSGASAPTVTIGDLLAQEVAVLKRLEEQHLELRRIHSGKRSARGELRRLRQAHRNLHRRLGGLERVLEGRRQALRSRVRALYRLVRRTATLPLLDSRRAHVPRDGRDVLLRIVRRDKQELHALRGEQRRLQRARADVQRRRAQAQAVFRDLERRRDEIQARIARCHQELKGVRYRRRRHRGLAKEWNAEAYRLEREIVAMTVRLRRQVVTFHSLKGRLVRPVPGMILSWFEGPQKRRPPGARARPLSRGVEISALPNWKVRSPARGTVRFTGSVPGFGRVIIVDHDEGYLSVIGFLGQVLVEVGREVSAGMVIARVGRKPHRGGRLAVYYELRQAGAALDPAPWLRGGRAEYRRRVASRKGRRRAPRAALSQADDKATAEHSP